MESSLTRIVIQITDAIQKNGVTETLDTFKHLVDIYMRESEDDVDVKRLMSTFQKPTLIEEGDDLCVCVCVWTGCFEKTIFFERLDPLWCALFYEFHLCLHRSVVQYVHEN